MKKLLYILVLSLGFGAFAQHPLIDAQFKGVYDNDTIILNLNSLGRASKYDIAYETRFYRGYVDMFKHHFSYENSENITFIDENTILYRKKSTDEVSEDAFLSYRGIENLEFKRVIPDKDEKFVKVDITVYELESDIDVPIITTITTFKDYGNDIKNNISLVNHLNLLDFTLHNYELYQAGKFKICCGNCFEARAMPPSSREMSKNEKGNITGISKCHYTPSNEEFSFKYNSSDKLSEIKTEKHLYKIEWL